MTNNLKSRIHHHEFHELKMAFPGLEWRSDFQEPVAAFGTKEINDVKFSIAVGDSRVVQWNITLKIDYEKHGYSKVCLDWNHFLESDPKPCKIDILDDTKEQIRKAISCMENISSSFEELSLFLKSII
jgi:hypothetical protein